MKNKPFLYDIKADVKLKESNETGAVIGRAEYEDSANSYLIRYRAGDGRQTEAWWAESAIGPA
ncbi:hypothetical protein ACIPUD_11020 [Bradyrhizobium sp. CAR08]|uniref:hypothetical protein n=1 Tax=unclassified Bradyrhizobium TaxID=2631580 RepID=UPI001FF9A14A|nr:hypothetical protein [Bradyrhizobium sp. 174]MCK1577847.1 hypothetical protein [Bradyrhizobium sp. 174]